tara:strand:+ start:153 stop:758 length:606 start_codon:yes stop_codon:yes gene_type:complete
MTCPACEKRQAEELQKLSDCEGRCKEISVKNQRLTLALTVVSTLAGKETLDYALGLSSSLGAITSMRETPGGNLAQGLDVIDQDGSLSPEAQASDVVTEELPRLVEGAGIPTHNLFDNQAYPVGSYLPDASVLVSDSYESSVITFQEYDVTGDVPIWITTEDSQDLLLFPDIWGAEYTTIPEAGILPLVTFSCFFTGRRRV